MSKTEPMGVDDMRRCLIEIDGAYESYADDHYRCFVVERRLILAWIHAEARARYWELDRHTKHTPSKEDFIIEVKKEVGWVD